MDTNKIEAETRTAVRKGVGRLRRTGKLPAVMYGAAAEPVAIQLNSHDAAILLNRLQGTVLIDLEVDGKVHKTVVRETQRDVVRGNLLHIDFMKVAMDQTIVTTVPISIIGEAPVLSQGDYMIVTLLNEVQIECLPGDLIGNINISAEEFTDPDSVVSVGDLFIPKGITLLSSPEDVIARVSFASRVTEEEEAEDEEFDAEDFEVLERGKDEEGDVAGEQPETFDE